MTEDVTIFHNPRCSKSRQALQLLEEKGITPKVIRYLEEPPGPETLRDLLARLGMGPRELMRKKEAEYRELGLEDPALDDSALIDALVRHPRLLERPIVLAGDRAVIGRPPERILDIL